MKKNIYIKLITHLQESSISSGDSSPERFLDLYWIPFQNSLVQEEGVF